ncbi:Aldo/keto reductase [Peniophora sp. CONT]|nr:Aldo/keto reductase [Peniophora sp. CONT]
MPSIATRKIGHTDVSAIGYGAMSIAGTMYSPGKVLPDEERFEVLDAVVKFGCTNVDTADAYRDAEDLIGKWFARSPEKRSSIFLATKFGIRGYPSAVYVDGRPEYVREALEKSLARLQTSYVDLYYLHRADRRTPIEHTVGAMAELVKEGKVKQLGISGVTVNTLRRAHAVHPIAALQIEYSPFNLDAERNGLIDACRELGIAVVAYSPLGRGLLTGRYRSPDDFDADDGRRRFPQFSHENFPKILAVVDVIKAIGEKHDVSAGTVTLAWVLAQGAIPIPGTRSVKYLEENIAGAKLELSKEEVQEIRDAAEKCVVDGPRLAAGFEELLPVETPPP